MHRTRSLPHGFSVLCLTAMAPSLPARAEVDCSTCSAGLIDCEIQIGTTHSLPWTPEDPNPGTTRERNSILRITQLDAQNKPIQGVLEGNFWDTPFSIPVELEDLSAGPDTSEPERYACCHRAA